MANATISDLTLASSVADTDVLLVENSTDTKKTTKKILLSGCSKEGHTHSFNELTDKPSTIDGEDGATFTPSVDSKGNLSWSNNKGLTNPTTVNIKGAKGDKGDQGIQGKQGEKGDKGDQGIQGKQGAKGDKGDTGATPKITIGTVTTGAAGTNAAATITGTTPNLVLNLTIPQGAKGSTGSQGKQGIQGEPGKDLSAEVAALQAKVAELEAAIQDLQQPTQVKEQQGSDE